MNEKRRLKRKATLLWTLVTTTPGVAGLAEPMQRAEFSYDRLTQSQRVTVAVIVTQLVKGFDDIDKDEAQKAENESTASAEVQTATAEIVTDDRKEG